MKVEKRSVLFLVMAGVAIALILAFTLNVNVQVRTAESEATKDLATKSASISDYKIVRIGDGPLANMIQSKVGTPRAFERVTQVPDSADRHTVIFFADGEAIKKDDAAFMGKVNKLSQVDKAPTFMATEDKKAMRDMAHILGIKAPVAEDTLAIGYWLLPPGAMCKTDPGVYISCSGAPMEMLVSENTDSQWEKEHPAEAALVKQQHKEALANELLQWLGQVQ